MQKQLGDVAVNAAGGVLSGAVCAVVGNLWLGPHPSGHDTLIVALVGAVVVLVTLMSLRYYILLGYGTAAAGSLEQARYLRLRDELDRESGVAALYSDRLRRGLAAVDRFFDGVTWRTESGAGQSVWTARAFDRCVLIALIYPIATVFLSWTTTGTVGPAERALRLPVAESYQRAAVGVLVGGIILAMWQSFRLDGVRSQLWVVFSVLIVLMISLIIGTASMPLALMAMLIPILLSPYDEDEDEAIGIYIILGITTLLGVITIIASTNVSWIVTTLFSPVIGAFMIGLRRLANLHKNVGYHPVTIVVIAVTCLVTAYLVALYFGTAGNFGINGPTLLFVVVLTIVNAPFDWFSIGFTRHLVHRGLVLGGWWPVLLGIIDAAACVVTLGLLAVAVLVAIIAFNAATIIGRGTVPVLDVSRTLAALADPVQRLHPEYVWLYVMLFSTMVPSIANLAIGALSVCRGMAPLNRAIYARMPADRGVLSVDAAWMAFALAIQVVASILLGVFAMAGLLWITLHGVLPAFGITLLEMLNEVARVMPFGM